MHKSNKIVRFVSANEERNINLMQYLFDLYIFWQCESDNGYKHAFVPAAWTVSPPAHSPSARHSVGASGTPKAADASVYRESFI